MQPIIALTILVILACFHAQMNVSLTWSVARILANNGFIPLQQLGRFIDKGINNGLKMGYVDLHKLLSHRGIPNCIDGQFEISTGLNISLWEHLLQGNRNHQLKIFS